MNKLLPPPARHWQTYDCDVLIAGAGFAGALASLVLHQQGLSVCLLEKGRHPRFAIGESSTPVADLLLRELSRQYNLPWLHPLSRYGSWQERYPEIVCGIKRGFSYFKHYPHREFVTDDGHSQELFVAASMSDQVSDTNWLRADFDTFLVEKVKEAGINYLDLAEITAARKDHRWSFQVFRRDAAEPGKYKIAASFFIDASGGGALLETLLGVRSSARDFETDSYAIFSHFDDIPPWSGMLQRAHIPMHDYPYDPDHSALHQILEEGWVWMLRFNDRRTSLGFALDRGVLPPSGGQIQPRWDNLLNKYPSLGRLLDGVRLSAQPGRLIETDRLQRRADRCAGPGWAALPHTAGFVDPLFSSGIAQTLMGIQRLCRILVRDWSDNIALACELREYERAVFAELRLIDCLVAGCYATMPYFAMFQAWSMLYFAATITCEQRLLREGPGGYFLGADNLAIWEMVKECNLALRQVLGNKSPGARAGARPGPSETEVLRFIALVREKIAPFNKAGLMEPAARNMYRHTIAEL
ncbi:MAG TPA: tryptophan 7-halogenase [Puia sp.]|nr:tryptophan 7-halogenase [Puia sp.]